MYNFMVFYVDLSNTIAVNLKKYYNNIILNGLADLFGGGDLQ